MSVRCARQNERDRRSAAAGAAAARPLIALVSVALVMATGPGVLPPAAGAQDTAGAAPDSQAATQANLPEPLRGVGFDQKPGEQVPLDILLVDENEREIEFGSLLRGKPVILTLVYYECPMLCSLVLNGMAGALKAVPFELGEDYDIITVSFDTAETPRLARNKQANYLREYGLEGHETDWRFLVGDDANVERLTEAVGFRYAYDAETDQFAHTAGIMLLTPEGKVARYFFGVEFSPRDLRLGLVEASENEIGSVVDQVLLYCYAYNPVSGTYAATALTLVRLGGVVTIVVLAVFLTIMLRRDRRQRHSTGAAS